MSLRNTIAKFISAIGMVILLVFGFHYRFHLLFYVANQKSCAKIIAFSYMDGANGFLPNYEKARYWLYKSSENGDGESMSHLAWFLETGRGGPSNKDEALIWYHKAQQHGDKHAETYLKNRGLLVSSAP
jgi:TPR repeat protein